MSAPSVQITETSRPMFIPRITNEVAAFVGHFERGPINTPIYITNIDEFKFLFGRGVENHFNDWYQVYNFLQYASGIWVIRTSGNDKINANNGSDLFVNTYQDWVNQKDSITADNIRFIARTAGSWGNLLTIGVITKDIWNANASINGTLRARDVFEFFEEEHLGVCIFRDGDLVEKYYKTYFNIEEINEDSLYVYVKTNDKLSGFQDLESIEDFFDQEGRIDLGGFQSLDGREDMGLLTQYMNKSVDLGTVLETFRDYVEDNYAYYGNNIISFTNGFNAFPTDVDFASSYEILEDKEDYEIDILIGNERVNYLAVQTAEKRRDCMAFIGIPTSFITYLKLNMGVGNPQETAYTQSGLVIATNEMKIPPKLNDAVIEKLNGYIESIPHSQFAHFTLDIKMQLDLFTNKYRLVNVAGDIAGLKSKASLISPWIASAGLEKGRIQNVRKMYINLTDTQRNNYYKKGLNFITNNTLMSQKTYYTKPSSFNRVNVRSLFNHIERETKKILNNYIFEENTLRIRQTIASQVKRYLEDVRVNDGIQNGRVEVYPSDTNPNEIIVDVYVQPTYVAEYIQLRMSNVGTNELTSTIS
jgi:hypothetical protein